MSAVAKGPARRFDHDRARAMRKAGHSFAAIAQEFGVTTSAIQRVCKPEFRARMAARTAIAQRSGICSDCGGPMSCNPYDKNPKRPLARCRSCYYIWNRQTS